jgi:hypothetical protein
VGAYALNLNLNYDKAVTKKYTRKKFAIFLTRNSAVGKHPLIAKHTASLLSKQKTMIIS